MLSRRALGVGTAAALIAAAAVGGAAMQVLGHDVESDDEVSVVAVGDIACDPDDPRGERECAHARTAKTAVDLEPDAVLLLGDIQYPEGELEDFVEPGGYTGTWSQLHDRTWPAPGNHEWRDADAAGYQKFFEDRIDGALWYSRDIGGWHVVSLVSDCDEVGGCTRGSEQYEWLVDDLARSDGRPTLLMWHNPRFSSGRHGGDRDLEDIWDLAVGDPDVQLVLSAHSHSYERMPPLDEEGQVSEEGLRSFVVGTGGADHVCSRTEDQPDPEVYDCSSFGVLRLALRPDGYTWRFVPSTGEFRDEGAAGLRTGAPAQRVP